VSRGARQCSFVPAVCETGTVESYQGGPPTSWRPIRKRIGSTLAGPQRRAYERIKLNKREPSVRQEELIARRLVSLPLVDARRPSASWLRGARLASPCQDSRAMSVAEPGNAAAAKELARQPQLTFKEIALRLRTTADEFEASWPGRQIEVEGRLMLTPGAVASTVLLAAVAGVVAWMVTSRWAPRASVTGGRSASELGYRLLACSAVGNERYPSEEVAGRSARGDKSAGSYRSGAGYERDRGGCVRPSAAAALARARSHWARSPHLF